MFKSAFAVAAVASAPFLASSAFAGPYVESKTTTARTNGDYTGTQTELRVGYETQASKTVNVYGEIGPGYEWNTGKIKNEYVTVGEIGVTAPLAEKVALKAKVTGEYGGSTKIFDLGGELKVRYTF